MRITQGTFSFLPDLTDAEIRAQVDYALAQGWAISVEYTDDPHPRNFYWEMWGNPMFDLRDGAGASVDMARSHASVVHRQPAGRRAGIQPEAPGRSGPQRDLHHR